MRRWGSILGLGLIVFAGCSASGEPAVPASPQAGTEAPAAEPVRPAFELDGNMQQGGVVRGTVPSGTARLTLDGAPVEIDPDGHFIIGFGRDHGPSATLAAELADGGRVAEALAIRPTEWRIEHINAPLRAGVSSAEFQRRRAPELQQIAAARAVRSDSQGWRQDFLWPATGRLSSRFGQQRIYQGEPGSYHSGVDIARPAGTPVVAPADGVVILAAQTPFTLEGHLLMIDHGMGLNSAFLHLSRIDVAVGDHVARGQTVGAIGSSGRATGAHLHWSMKWQDERIDPSFLAGPMPGGGL